MFIGITGWSGAFFFSFLIKKEKKNKEKKLEPKKKHQIGMVLTPKTLAASKSCCQGAWCHEAAPPWRGCRGLRGGDLGVAREGHV